MSGNLLWSFNILGVGLIGYVIPFLVVLTIVVFFHELGHFLIARACGIRILVFSIGFGPELIGFDDRYGTRWKISAIPLGGYVKFFGDENAASVPDASAVTQMSAAERKVSFFHQPGRLACGGRGRRPTGKFRSGDRHLCGNLCGLRQGIDRGPGRLGAAWECGRSRRLPARRSGRVD